LTNWGGYWGEASLGLTSCIPVFPYTATCEQGTGTEMGAPFFWDRDRDREVGGGDHAAVLFTALYRVSLRAISVGR
jgi:hypothetical protein